MIVDYIQDLEFSVRCEKLSLVSPENVQVTLPESEAGTVTSDLSCFSTGEAFTTAVCDINNGSFSWTNITWHPCDMEEETNHTKILRGYVNTTITMENVDEIAVNLSSETKYPFSLSKEDMTYAAVILEKITDVKELGFSVVKSVSSTVSNLMNLDGSKLGSFHKFIHNFTYTFLFEEHCNCK